MLNFLDFARPLARRLLVTVAVLVLSAVALNQSAGTAGTDEPSRFIPALSALSTIRELTISGNTTPAGGRNSVVWRIDCAASSHHFQPWSD